MCEHSMCALYGSTPMCEHSYVSTLCVDHSTRFTTQTRIQFLGRMLRNTEKYENYHGTKMNISSWAGCCSAKNVKKARVLL